MKLNEIRDNDGARKARMRICRGIGSGKGKTGGRGGKGQTARTGVAINGFEGGQMPLYRRLPKRGFNNIFANKYAEINLGRLQAAIDKGIVDASKEINADVLCQAGVLKQSYDGLRLLGNGELKSKVTIKVCGSTAAAKASVEKAGGQVIIAE